MRRIILRGAVTCAAIGATLFAMAAGAGAQSTPTSAITVCSTGVVINVDGKNFESNVDILVWFGALFSPFQLAATTSPTGTFDVSFDLADLATAGPDVVVTDTSGNNPFSAPIPSVVPPCANTGGAGIASQVVLSGAPPTTLVAHPSVTLHGQLADSSGKPATTPGIMITFTGSDGSTATCTTDITGACTVPFALTSLGESFTANIPGGTGTFGGSLQLSGIAASAPSPTQTTIAAAPGSIAADGTSTATVTVQAKDVFGFNETTSAGPVVLTLTPANGSLSQVTDNNNGTYTATLTSSKSAGQVRINGTLNGSPIAGAAFVNFNQAASPTLSAIGTSPTSIAADGTSTTTVTVHVKDLLGADFAGNAGTVTVSTTLGSFAGGCTSNCPTQFTGNGGYSATLTSGVNAGTATITGTINNASMSRSATVTFTPVASPSNSTISVSAASVPADGTSKATITVQIKDLGGANFPSGGGAVVLMTTAGTLSGVVDNANGTYTATITGTSAGTATITGTFNGTAIPGSATVTFTSLALNAGCSSAGDVNGGLNAKGGLQINIEADCDPADKKHPTVYLHHAHLHVDGLGLKIDAETNEDGKKTDIKSVSYAGSTATITGTANGQPFVLTVTDNGRGSADTYIFIYGGRVYTSAGMKTDGDIHVTSGS